MPSVTGQQLIRLLQRDGWVLGGRRTHGVFLYKRFPGDSYPRSTVIPDKAEDLPPTTLGAILSVKQTGLGRRGLQELIESYGLG